jgi:hypothetical protein
MTTKTLKKNLLCQLTEDEQRNCGIKLAATLEDIDRLEAEKKAQGDQYKRRIDGLHGFANELRNKVTTSQEWREVECDVVLGQPTPDHKQIVRKDTGEIVETLSMTVSDRQTLLPLDDEDEERNDLEVAADLEEGAGDAWSPGDPAPHAPEPTPIELAKAEGVQAFHAGKDLNRDCPYKTTKKQRPLAEAWGEGWLGESNRESAAGDPMPAEDPEAPVPVGATAESEDY